MLKRIIPILFFLALIPVSVLAVPQGKSIFPKPGIELLTLTGKAEMGKVEKVPVEGQPFKEALRLTTLSQGTNPWDVQVHVEMPAPVQAGEALLAEFWVRAVVTQGESGEALSEFGFERVGDPWTKSVSYNLSITQQWKKYSVPFTAEESLEAGKSQAYFRMGYKPQVFEIADFKILSYGTGVKLEDLPKTQMTYPGAEADAPWRKEAADRIEKIRKGDLAVLVTDAKGGAVSGAKVSVRMKRQAFGFGTAVVAQDLVKAGGDNDRYQKEVERLFNRIVFENDLKWGPWEEGASNTGYWRREYVDGAVKWLAERNIDIRGHNMVWGTWRYIPADIKKLEGDKPALEQAIEHRIADVGGAMAGKVVDWDVVNESVPEHDLTDIFGKQQMVTWYKAARKADPKALLFLNDYPSPDTTGHLDGFVADIKMLLDNHAPLGGIGLQGHVGGSPWSIPALLQELDRLGAFGLPIEITEYDTDIKDEQLDAQFLKDFLTAVYSHPSVQAYLMWGFWDGAHWHHKAPVFNQDWTEKPSGKAYEELVLHDWWTNADGATDDSGAFRTRGFLGDYEVTVASGTKSVTVNAKLGKDGLKLPVVLK